MKAENGLVPARVFFCWVHILANSEAYINTLFFALFICGSRDGGEEESGGEEGEQEHQDETTATAPASATESEIKAQKPLVRKSTISDEAAAWNEGIRLSAKDENAVVSVTESEQKQQGQAVEAQSNLNKPKKIKGGGIVRASTVNRDS